MNINNYNNFNTQNFKGGFTQKTNIEARLDKLAQGAIAAIQSDKYNTSYFDIPGSNYQALLMLKKAVKESDNATLSVGIKERGDDKILKRIIDYGTNEEISQKVSNLESKKVVEAIKELDAKFE